MSDDPKKTENELMKATAEAIKQPREKSKLERARDLIGNLSEALEKEEKEKGYDIAIGPDFEADAKTIPIPKVRLLRKSRIEDSLKAEQICKIHFGNNSDNYTATGQHMLLAKLSILCTFDDKVWNIPEIQKLGEDFFTHVTVKFSKFLT
jgi:hypothetical protein